MVVLIVLAAVVADPTLTRLAAEDARVAAMSWRMQTKNAALCPDITPITGLTLHALSQYRRAKHAAVRLQFGLSDRVGVAAVAPGSAADRSGIRPGDIILSVDGRAAPVVTPDAGYTPVGEAEALIDAALQTAPADLLVRRIDGGEKLVTLSGDPACASRVQIVAGSGINAQADGRYVQINTGMLDFAASDDELAVLVGHELAHNILRHVALQTPSRDAEFQADRLGVWLTARAGYDVDAVVPFWTRFERRTNAGIFADGTHPSSKKRLAAVTAAVAQLKAQRAAGKPLIPPPAASAQ